jgi:hypothetical protein
MRIYISGGMTGYPNLNFPAFDNARDKLKEGGHEVVSPADLERNRKMMTYEEAMKDDLKHLLTCDAIYLIRGWQGSSGAQVEFLVAQICGLQIFYQR